MIRTSAGTLPQSSKVSGAGLLRAIGSGALVTTGRQCCVGSSGQGRKRSHHRPNSCHWRRLSSSSGSGVIDSRTTLLSGAGYSRGLRAVSFLLTLRG
jgi:hypothetical protein